MVPIVILGLLLNTLLFLRGNTASSNQALVRKASHKIMVLTPLLVLGTAFFDYMTDALTNMTGSSFGSINYRDAFVHLWAYAYRFNMTINIMVIALLAMGLVLAVQLNRWLIYVCLLFTSLIMIYYIAISIGFIGDIALL